jgi:hypothetical protein
MSSIGDLAPDDPRRFKEAIAPTVRVLRELAAVMIDTRTPFGDRPAVPSVAMDELVLEEERYGKWSSWTRPLSDTHSLGSVLLDAAADNVRCYATLFDQERAPVFGHLVIARAALETCVYSTWLNDPTLDAVERMKRGLAEQIHSAREQQRITRFRAHGKRVESELEAVAAKFRWTVKSKGAEVGGARRPWMRTALSTMLVGDDEREIGQALWGYLSAVTHGTWYGLRESVTAPQERPDPVTGLQLASLGTDSRSVNIQTVWLLRLFVAASNARMILMGWESLDWDIARRHAEELRSVLMGNITRFNESP